MILKLEIKPQRLEDDWEIEDEYILSCPVLQTELTRREMIYYLQMVNSPIAGAIAETSRGLEAALVIWAKERKRLMLTWEQDGVSWCCNVTVASVRMVEDFDRILEF